MKRFFSLFFLLIFLLSGCSAGEKTQVAATTLPVYDFTARLCQGTDISVTRIVTENVSCLHDYTVSVRQMRAIENAELIVISGVELEHFMEDMLSGREVVDASQGIALLEGEDHSHDPIEESDHHGHAHDPHIWLAPENAKSMVRNICRGLQEKYPQHKDTFALNQEALLAELDKLQAYGKETLSRLQCREIITFHDGFSYFAQAFDLEILEAVEEESGSEASASELKHLITLTQERKLPAIFTEKSGSTAAANVIASQTGVRVFVLDMAMSGDSYLESMYHNINTIKEALG